MSHRIVAGLKSAAALAKRPGFIPVGRPRGIKAAGLRYERGLAKAHPWLEAGRWWEFVDYAGAGWCQTDLFLERPEYALVLEAKLSWVPEAHTQISQLYEPVIRYALEKPVFGVVVTKRLKPGIPRYVKVEGSLQAALAHASAGRPAVWHWLGVSAEAEPRLGPTAGKSSPAHLGF